MFFENVHSKNNYHTVFECEDLACYPHCQTTYEMIFVTSGCINIEFGKRIFSIKEKECIFILPYEIHRIFTIDKSNILVFIFSVDYIPDFHNEMKNQRLLCPVIPYNPEILHILKQKSPNRYMLKSVLYRLCSDFISGGVDKINSNSETDISVQIIMYLQEHYKEPLRLQTLANALGYSYTYTSAIFNQWFKQSFSDIVNEYRLSEALRLLKTKELTITEISSECGFSTIRNFNISFKKRFGLSPSQYRSKKSFPQKII